jgi:hypothetical protein
MIRPIVTLALASLIVQATVIAANAQIAFTYHAPGDLVAGSGRNDRTIYFPDIMFPLAVGPSAGNVQAFAHSQIHPPADRNAYPWRDTYCEPREWSMSLCPTEKGHQGDDISPFTNENVKWSAVAMDDGVVTQISPFTVVTIRSKSNFYCRYMHLDPGSIAAAGLREGQEIRRGALVGKVSNIMDGTPSTSIHLHFDCYKIMGGKIVRLPVYTSLISAYRVAWGMEALNEGGKLGFDTARELPFGGVAPVPPPGMADTSLPISFRTKNYGAITPQTEPDFWPKYILIWPGLLDPKLAAFQIRDKFAHIVPAFATDEEGIGLWWYWMVRRGEFGANGIVTFERIALKYAGSEDVTSPEVREYLSDYTGLSLPIFGHSVSANENLNLADLDTRWNIARTMFQHESGKSGLFDRATFERGIALATTILNGGTVMPGPGTPSGPGTPGTPTEPGTPSRPGTPTGPSQPGPIGTTPLANGVMELIFGKYVLRFDANVDVTALSRILSELEKRH